jgi:CRP/FNR family cyclic AMP-dependent transcriptional regulator
MVQVTDEIKRKLGKVVIFRYLSEEELEHIINVSEMIEVEAGVPIVSEGTANQDLFVVMAGCVNVTTAGDADREVFISALGEGDVFGEAGIFLTVRRTANVVSAEKTNLLRIQRKSLLGFFKEYPSAGIKLLMILVYSLLKKLRGSNQELAFERKGDIQQDDIDALVDSLMKDD